MDSATDASYQDDILKVKQIWNDIKDVGKPDKKKPQTSKGVKRHQNNNKTNQGSKSIRPKHQAQQSQSQINLNPPQHPEQAQTSIIKFSTLKPYPIPNHTHSGPTNQPTFNPSHATTNFHHRQAIQQKDLELSLLRVENQRMKDQINRLQKKISQQQEVIERFKKREDELLGVTRKFSSEKVQQVDRGVEYMNYKSDAKRLLKMLEQTEEYNYFAKLAIDDQGVRRLGLTGKKSKLDLGHGASNSNKQKSQRRLHFCSCHLQFIPQDNFWVPQKVYDFSKDYVKQHKGQTLSQTELELMLYELNNIWREREKRIFNWLKGENARDLGKYKGKVQGLRSEVKGQRQ